MKYIAVRAYKVAGKEKPVIEAGAEVEFDTSIDESRHDVAVLLVEGRIGAHVTVKAPKDARSGDLVIEARYPMALLGPKVKAGTVLAKVQITGKQKQEERERIGRALCDGALSSFLVAEGDAPEPETDSDRIIVLEEEVASVTQERDALRGEVERLQAEVESLKDELTETGESGAPADGAPAPAQDAPGGE